ncbi:hypothetical protein ACH45E_10135 [Streptomyces sp. NPDC020299]|uniref:hypothetical protein n=1 Tax=Streptomyces sp. NPDC020299 TaxID=3365067 RepID=UPI0037B143B2
MRSINQHSVQLAGRGLHLVQAYADDWGWFHVNGPQRKDGNGKYVWCELAAKPAE